MFQIGLVLRHQILEHLISLVVSLAQLVYPSVALPAELVFQDTEGSSKFAAFLAKNKGISTFATLSKVYCDSLNILKITNNFS